MKNEKVKNSKITASTQLYLDIAEIKNNLVVLKDGTLRAVLFVSSVNFALKSEDEQNAIVSSYVSFLNYLNFPIQVVIQSRKLNIDNYLERLKDSEKKLTNDLLKKQIVNYRAYIRELVELGDIMSKRFFIIVPYSPVEDKKRGFWNRLGDVFTPGKVIRLKKEKFDRYARELDQRVGHVMMNLGGMGLTAVQLDTQSLIELYYNVYNPHVSESQRLVDADKVRIEKL